MKYVLEFSEINLRKHTLLKQSMLKLVFLINNINDIDSNTVKYLFKCKLYKYCVRLE